MLAPVGRTHPGSDRSAPGHAGPATGRVDSAHRSLLRRTGPRSVGRPVDPVKRRGGTVDRADRRLLADRGAATTAGRIAHHRSTRPAVRAPSVAASPETSPRSHLMCDRVALAGNSADVMV